MQRISTSSAVADLFGSGKAGFRNGDLPRGVLPTAFNAEWCNHVQEEICNVIEGAGVALNPDKRDQLLAALKKLIDEQAGGKGLPVGAVIGFPRAITSQEGYLKADGSTFNQSAYPDLYRVLGGNKLPNLTRSDIGMTAYFPVADIPDGWIKYDDISTKVTQAAYPELYRKLVAQYGSIAAVPKAEDRFIRNAAGGLTVGTQQGDAIRNIKGKTSFCGDDNGTLGIGPKDPEGVFGGEGSPNAYTADTDRRRQGYNYLTFDASRSVPVADEVRPKAIVMVLCIKAQNSLDDVVMWVKAFGKVTNAGVLDASTLAAGLQNKSDKGHTHRAAEITDFAEAVAALTVHQKIGTFDICRLPDGTQIESGTVRIQNHNNNPTARVLTWPLAFVTAPVVVATISAPEVNVRDVWVTIDSRQSNRSAVHYWLYEPNYNTPDVTVNFVAIGRWK
ncbi:tail fiber protein [Neisseria sp. P0001.S004]|uniref:phage tail protein n=1 Tax=Neisseria sp. P0001.S005 TaxID=3436649 RepID=UPI003F7DFCCF